MYPDEETKETEQTPYSPTQETTSSVATRAEYTKSSNNKYKKAAVSITEEINTTCREQHNGIMPKRKHSVEL